jgi:hypothetical protein
MLSIDLVTFSSFLHKKSQLDVLSVNGNFCPKSERATRPHSLPGRGALALKGNSGWKNVKEQFGGGMLY